jgi:hypothetical protein
MSTDQQTRKNAVRRARRDLEKPGMKRPNSRPRWLAHPKERDTQLFLSQCAVASPQIRLSISITHEEGSFACWIAQVPQCLTTNISAFPHGARGHDHPSQRCSSTNSSEAPLARNPKGQNCPEEWPIGKHCVQWVEILEG